MNNNSTIQQFNNVFAFILGREQKIALAELEAVLRRFGFCFPENKNHPERALSDKDESKGAPCCSVLSLQDNIALFKFPETCHLSPVTLMSQLGGTVKIYKITAAIDRRDILSKALVNELSLNNSSGTLNFAISDFADAYTPKQLNEIGIQTKIYARKRRPVRYIASKDAELSSATSYHKIYKTGGVEFGLFKIAKLLNCYIAGEQEGPEDQKVSNNTTIQQYDNKLLIGRLVATSNPDEWSDRDYGKPAGDKFSGMMPPKLARALVNLALDPANSKHEALNIFCKSTVGQPEGSPLGRSNTASNITIKQYNNEDQKPVVFDPFCGSGNILMEALLLGCDVIGSDISPKAVEDTKTNLRWLSSKFEARSTEQIPSSSDSNSRIENYDIDNSLKIENCKIENYLFEADATTFDFAEKIAQLVIPSETASKRGVEESLHDNFEPSTCDVVIITEPYLGRPKKEKVERSKIKEEIGELKKLYLEFFNNLAIQQFSNNAVKIASIVFVFPVVSTVDAGEVSLYDECVDDLTKMGYSGVRTLKYGRDYQVVKREIAVLLPPKRESLSNPKGPHRGEILSNN